MQTLFAILSIALGFAAYAPYFFEMWKGTVRPHLFSWITWMVLTALGFVLSLRAGGGAGAWTMAVQSALCLAVIVYALFRGERNITRLDRLAFLAAIATTVVYLFTKNAIASILLAATIDSLGFVPTFRKSYARPFDEPPLTYALSMLCYLFSIAALAHVTLVTAFYPAILVATNGTFVIFLLVRRRQIR